MRKYILAFFVGFVVGGAFLSLMFFFPVGLSLAATIGLFIGLSIATGLMADVLVFAWSKVFSKTAPAIKNNDPTEENRLKNEVQTSIQPTITAIEATKTKNAATPQQTEEPPKAQPENRVEVNRKPEPATKDEIAAKLAEREITIEWLRQHIATATKEEITQRLILLYQLRQYYSVSAEQYKEKWQNYVRLTDLYPVATSQVPNQDFDAYLTSNNQSYEGLTLLFLESLLIADIIFAHVETKCAETKSEQTKQSDEPVTMTPKDFASTLRIQDHRTNSYKHFFFGICGHPVKNFFQGQSGEPLWDQPLCKKIFAAPPEEASAPPPPSESQPWRWGFMHNHFAEFGLYGSYSTPFWRMDKKERVIQPVNNKQNDSKSMQSVPKANPLAAELIKSDDRFYKWTSQLPTAEFPENDKYDISTLCFSYPSTTPT